MSTDSFRTAVLSAYGVTSLDDLDDDVARMHAEFALTDPDRGISIVHRIGVKRFPGARVLDLGCGRGGFLHAALEAGAAEVVGVELNEELVALSQHLVPGAVAHGDATLTPRAIDGPFDIVNANDVIEHVDDPYALVAQVSDQLAPGGIAHFEVPNYRAMAHIAADGHYNMPGLTMLDRDEAAEHFWERRGQAARGAEPYGVEVYGSLTSYLALLSVEHLYASVWVHTFEKERRYLEQLQRDVDLAAQALNRMEGQHWEVAVERGLAEVQACSDMLTRWAALPDGGQKMMLEKHLLYTWALPFWQVLVRKDPTRSPA